jgi:hypothetical protein
MCVDINNHPVHYLRLMQEWFDYPRIRDDLACSDVN